jgi:hypothetical protein
MEDAQAIAIYYRLQGERQPKEVKEKVDVSPQQLALF